MYSSTIYDPYDSMSSASSAGTWAYSSQSTTDTDSCDSDDSDEEEIEIGVLPEEITRLLAKPGARVLPDANDYGDPLWLLEGPESEMDYNRWDVAYFEPRQDVWIIRKVVKWWGYYEDPDPSYTDWFIEPYLGLIADNGEPAIRWGTNLYEV